MPGLLLAGMYAGYVFLVSMVRKDAAPALPPEARAIREDNGSSGVLSLLVMVALVIAGTYGFEVLLRSWAPGWAHQNEFILASSLAILVAYIIASANRLLKLGILSRLAESVIIVMVPPLALIFLVLGTIFLGIATPTEGGAMGATGALILALAKRQLSFSLLVQALDQTAKLSAFVMFILIGARVFSLTFYGVNGHRWVENLLIGLPGGAVGFLIVVNILVFFLAFFLDFFELAFIVVPLLAPAASALGIDLIWFGVMLSVNMQTSFMHPPFGFSLFYLRSVAPARPYTDRVTGKVMEGIRTGQIYWGAIPFVVIQCIMIGLIIAFPKLVLHYRTEPMDASKVQIEMPSLDTFGLPGLGAPSTAPAPGAPGTAPAAPPRDTSLPPPIDLGPPPKF